MHKKPLKFRGRVNRRARKGRKLADRFFRRHSLFNEQSGLPDVYKMAEFLLVHPNLTSRSSL